jgi:hypothetical protein
VTFTFGRQATRLAGGGLGRLVVGCLPVTLSLLDRAAGQSLTGIVANDPEQAVDLVTFIDDHGANSRAMLAMRSSSLATTCPRWTRCGR